MSEAEWRAEFERLGEVQVADTFNRGLINIEAKRQFAFRWLGERAQERTDRERQSFWYAKWTFYAAVAAVLVGVIGSIAGVLVTLLH